MNYLFPLVLLDVIFFSGGFVYSAQYDYASSIECLIDPLKPQYGGGIIQNPEFNHGINGWSSYGLTNATARKSSNGNFFGVATNRTYYNQSISQTVYLKQEMIYTFSTWLQVGEGESAIRAVFKTSDEIIPAGTVDAKSGCWSMLKGGLTVQKSGPAQLYFESNNTVVELWVDSVSVQPFSQEEWRSHQSDSISKVRKKVMRFRAVDTYGNPTPNTTISLDLIRPKFPFGTAINADIIGNKAYQNWFTKRFHYTVFSNEMKWYSTETSPGKENYTLADKMMDFAQQNNIQVRGHTVLWDDFKFQMQWVQSLPTDQIRNAVDRRINSVVSRYKGRVIAWDVLNENIHYHWFEDQLGQDFSGQVYKKVSEMDKNTPLFLNEFNTLEHPEDPLVTPGKYLEKLKSIQLYPGNNAKMAIGLQGHFQSNAPNIPYIRSALDTLANGGVPIWLTEVDFRDQTQAPYLEAVLREAYAHPAVSGIMVWIGWINQQTCSVQMCFFDGNFNNLPAGDVVDKLIAEWQTNISSGTTDADGYFEANLFHGEYEMKFSHSSATSATVSSLSVDTESIKDVTFLIGT